MSVPDARLLDARLLEAHARGDRAALVTLYAEAGATAGSVDAACFYYTQAYVYGLELDHQEVPALFRRLQAQGRV